MTYSKTTWTNSSGQPISASNLNKIETGVADAHDEMARVIRPESFGAVGDGTINDYAALQSAADYITDNGGTLLLDGRKNYRINTAVTFTPHAGGPFWAVRGHMAKVTQATSNTPVFVIGDDYPSNFFIEGLWIRHASAQPATNTNAIGIRFDAVQGVSDGAGTFNFAIKRCQFDNSFRAMSQTESLNRPVWGAWIQNCVGAAGLSGAFFYHVNATANGAPNIVISDSYIVRNNSMTTQEPSIQLRYGVSCAFTNVEVNAGTGRVLFVQDSENIYLRNFRVEGTQMITADDSLTLFINTRLLADNMEFLTINFNSGSGTNQSLIQGGYASKLNIRGVNASNLTVASGVVPYLFRSPYGSPNNIAALNISDYTIPGNLFKYEATETWFSTALKNDDARTLVGSSQTIATGNTISLGNGISPTIPVTGTGTITGVILAAGAYDGQEITMVNRASVTMTFAAAATSRVAAGTAAVLPASKASRFVWDANYGGAGVGRWVSVGA